MLQRRVRFFRAPAPALGAAAGRGSASQYSCLTRCLEPTLIYKSSISVFPTILPQGEVSRIGEMAEKATLQHLNHPQGSPVHSPTRECHCHTSRNCKSPVSAASFTHHPLHDLIYKAKAVWQNSSHRIQMSVEQTGFLALAPFPSGCSGSGTDAAPRMSSSLFQVVFALGNLLGNQNKILLGL